MFNYWSAPPSLLRTWACPEEPSPAADGRFRFGSPAGMTRVAHDKEELHPSRIGGYLRALLFSRAAGPQLPAC